MAREIRPDLVVLDLGLPDGDGSKLIEPILVAARPAILVLSALDEEARKVNALDLGADGFRYQAVSRSPEFMARVRAALAITVCAYKAAKRFMTTAACASIWVKRYVRVNGADPKLTPREYALSAA